jgi:branched-chain amino acid transport system substrate-binding protein
MKIGGMHVYILDVPAIGQAAMAGLQFVDVFYWDMDEKSRAWSQ